MWQDIGAANDQSDIPSPILVEPVLRALEHIDKEGRLPTTVPSASKLYIAAKKLDRYHHQRVHGVITESNDGLVLSTDEMRTRLICSGDSVVTNIMRCLFAPLYLNQQRYPFTALANGANVQQVFQTFTKLIEEAMLVDF